MTMNKDVWTIVRATSQSSLEKNKEQVCIQESYQRHWHLFTSPQ